jgi:hypothetical protein
MAMPDKESKQPTSGGEPSGSAFFDTVVGFFSSVLKSIARDDLLRVLWGVEVLLFFILAFMIWFGDLAGDQRFNLALVIIASVVFMFAFSAWRSGRITSPPTDDGLIRQAEECLKLLTQIHDANARIIHRGQSGSAPWAKILTDTYGHVCHTCHERRHGTAPPDPYFDAICAEPDIDTVCVKKWTLGETLDAYRKRINRAFPPPQDHDDLELLIRRSVTQPNWSPVELQTALGQAIEAAKRIV